MEHLQEFKNRGQIRPRRLNPMVRAINMRKVFSGDGIIQTAETPQGTALRLSVEALLPRIPKVRGGGIWATITAYEEQEDGTLRYAWEAVDDDSLIGDAAVDLYDGRLALIDQYVCLSQGADDIYRFMWREPWESYLADCDSGVEAWAYDPTDPDNDDDDGRLVRVHRWAGFYEVDDRILVVPAYVTNASVFDEDDNWKWTIADRIPMAMREEPEGEWEGLGDLPAAEFQDDPDLAGCPAVEEE